MVLPNAGLIGARKQPTAGLASGVWSLRDQVNWKRSALWPGTPWRYYRFTEMTVSAFQEFREFVLVNNGVYVTGGTWTSSGVSITSAGMGDGNLSVGGFNTSGFSPGQFIQYDHGNFVNATGFKYAGWVDPHIRYITGVKVFGSTDGTNFFPIKTFSGLTAYTTTSTVVLSPEYSF